MWQPVAAVAVDAELALCGLLRTALAARNEPYAAALVSNKVPSPKDGQTRPARSVIVRRDGGEITAVIDKPRFGIRIFADNETDAANLGRLVAALILAMPGKGDGVVAVPTMSGLYEVPEQSPQFVRYLTCEVWFRASTLADPVDESSSS